MQKQRGYSLVEILVVLSILIVMLTAFASTRFTNTAKARRDSTVLVQSALHHARAKALATRKPHAFVWDGRGQFSNDVRGRAFAVFEVRLTESGEWLPEEQTLRWKSWERGVLIDGLFSENSNMISPVELNVSYDSTTLSMDALIVDARAQIIEPFGEGDFMMRFVTGSFQGGRKQITDFSDDGEAVTVSLHISRLTTLADVER